VQWVLGHSSIEGNEIAYQCAKLATRKDAKLVGEEGLQLKSRALQVSKE